ncbi:hypothetical protein LXA43DRAFT_1103887 [Ganoderma leucocontextum]|nr:hypothetical protein LXA43DRAFT_1103887 [Ganoderma leucocontextum]
MWRVQILTLYSLDIWDGPDGNTFHATYGSRDQRRLKLLAQARQRAQDRFATLTAGLDLQSRRVLAELRGEPWPDEEQDPTNAMADSLMAIDAGHELFGDREDQDADTHTGDGSDVPGDDAVAHAIRDLLNPRLRRRYLKDTRTWKQRLHTLDTRWQELLPRATDAFLRWKSRHSSPIPAVEPSEYDFEIDVLDLDTLQTVRLVPRRELPAAEALILDGYLAASPEKPTIAVSLATLEMFRTLRLVKPSLSVEGFTKFVCYKYCIPYRRRFRRAIADTFDVYLTIVERVRSRVLTALGRDSPNWRILHGCPACTYQVDGETPPTFARMVVMDGNNSLKRFAPVGNRDVGDTRIFESDYWLSMEFVNTFAGEVKARQLQPHVAVPEAEDDDAETEWEDDNGEGDPTDGAPDSACATNWKAAASDEKKRSWSVFHETGIFASCCRHGIMPSQNPAEI